MNVVPWEPNGDNYNNYNYSHNFLLQLHVICPMGTFESNINGDHLIIDKKTYFLN